MEACPGLLSSNSDLLPFLNHASYSKHFVYLIAARLLHHLKYLHCQFPKFYTKFDVRSVLEAKVQCEIAVGAEHTWKKLQGARQEQCISKN